MELESFRQQWKKELVKSTKKTPETSWQFSQRPAASQDKIKEESSSGSSSHPVKQVKKRDLPASDVAEEKEKIVETQDSSADVKKLCDDAIRYA